MQKASFWSQVVLVEAGNVCAKCGTANRAHARFCQNCGAKPARVHFATPSFYHGQAVPALVEGEMIADMVAIFASVDVVLGDCDR